MKISKWYELEDFLPKKVIDKYGEKSIQFIDKRLVDFGDWLCDYFGRKCWVNNWHEGGSIDSAGYRDPDDKAGAFRSAHKRGIAADFHVPDIDPEVVRNEIRRYFKDLNVRFGITTIEKDTPTWVHVDLRWTNMDELYEVPFK